MSISAWEPDPTGRHQYRWWDGERWTDQVANNGMQGVDSLSRSEAELPSWWRTPPSDQVDSLSSSEAELPHQTRTTLTTPPPPPGLPGEVSSAGHGSTLPDPLMLLATRGQRFGAYFMEFLLMIVTLGIGYLIWLLIVFAKGQTPGKQLLNMRVIRLEQRKAAHWGWMFLRQIVIATAISLGFTILIDLILLNLILSVNISLGVFIFVLLWYPANLIVFLTNDKNQAIPDTIIKTVVVKETAGEFDPPRQGY
ncbi:RDD family protein [Candidatus Poriferisocius sp.]|uniref:RDD family protein n=1 Tax=Candidatus Poriferisocius sp. TaxID=3101276 RepID=UPI003B027A5F